MAEGWDVGNLVFWGMFFLPKQSQRVLHGEKGGVPKTTKFVTFGNAESERVCAKGGGKAGGTKGENPGVHKGGACKL